jgi:hypothetical protein
MLRKTTALLALLLLFALPASAQIPGLAGIGVKGGVDFATIRSDEDDEEIGYQTDFVVGLYGQVPLANEYLTLQPEVLYARKGASSGNGSDDANANLNIDYIEIPVLLKANLPLEGQLVPNLYAGPYVSFAVNREFKISSNGNSGTQDLSDQISSTDYGLALGASFDTSLAGYGFTIGGRYDLGLANIDDTDSDVDASTGTFMVTLGFAL